ncbi:MAG: response regulator [Bacteroidetes bacterium]|nr:response regulator [Bacteroidota bacterium]
MKNKILVMDDDKDELLLIRHLLRARGYDVVISENGYGLGEKNLSNIDLFLVDINMPGILGTDVCQYLKKDRTTRDKPVILISASPELDVKALTCGADDYLLKPFSLTNLMRLLQFHLPAQKS